jgi:hypothetical protein
MTYVVGTGAEVQTAAIARRHSFDDKTALR